MNISSVRSMTAAGVVVAAILTAFLALPASWFLDRPMMLWLSALILVAPAALILVTTSAAYYGSSRSIAIAALVLAPTAVLTYLAATFAAAEALAGSVGPVAAMLLLLGVPALSVLLFGFAAMRLGGDDGRRATHRGPVPS